MVVFLEKIFSFIIFIASILLIIWVDLVSKNDKEKINRKERPSSVLVPDNVKKESQEKSTQNIDAKRYDVLTEIKNLEKNGYKKIGETTYSKTNIDTNVKRKSEREIEFDPINTKDDNVNPVNNNDDDNDNPIKEY